MKWNKITDADSAPKHEQCVLLAQRGWGTWFYHTGWWDNSCKRWLTGAGSFKVNKFHYWADIDAPEVTNE